MLTDDRDRIILADALDRVSGLAEALGLNASAKALCVIGLAVLYEDDEAIELAFKALKARYLDEAKREVGRDA